MCPCYTPENTRRHLYFWYFQGDKKGTLARYRSTEMFYKKGVFKNFAKFTGKHLCWSLFSNKVAGWKPAMLLKKRLWHMFFPVIFAKIWVKNNNFNFPTQFYYHQRRENVIIQQLNCHQNTKERGVHRTLQS